MLEACRAELRSQQELVARLVEEQLRPALRDLGTPILDVGDLDPSQRDFLARYFVDSVEPILIPLAADAAHPFPFISNLGLNLAVLVTEPGRRNRRFVRIKVPPNRPRWVPLPDHAGWVPLEQVIAGNLSALFPRAPEPACSFFRVTRGAKDDPWTDQAGDEDADLSPGAIIGMVTAELTARKYAGVVRLEVSADMPVDLRGWLATQLGADPADVIATPGLLSLGDLMELPVEGHAGQRDPPHEPVTHPRLRNLDRTDPAAIFDEILAGISWCTCRTTASTPRSCGSCRAPLWIPPFWRSSSRSTAPGAAPRSSGRSKRRPAAASRWRSWSRSPRASTRRRTSAGARSSNRRELTSRTAWSGSRRTSSWR